MKTRVLAAAAATAAIGLLATSGPWSRSGPTTVTVKRGDSLWAIAQRYHTTVAALAEANHMLPSDLLLIGRVLEIPASESETAEAKVGTAAAVGAASTSTGSLPNVPASQFCSAYHPSTAFRGVLPPALAYDSTRLALRSLFNEWGNYYGIRPALIEAIAWQESGWQEGVVSKAGAVGIGQIMPATVAFEGAVLGVPLRVNVVSDNIRMMAAFVGYLESQTGHNECATVASYYEGLSAYKHRGIFPMTRTYVADVLTLEQRFEG